MENKLKELSNKIVNYSLETKKDEKVLITCQTLKPKKLIEYLIEDIVKLEAIPFVRIIDESIETKLQQLTNENRIKQIKIHNVEDNQNYDSFITIRYSVNDYENSKVNIETRAKIKQAIANSDYIRINERKWVLLNYPSALDAYKSKKSIDDYFDYALEVMNIDYEDMYEKIKPLKEMMEKTNWVRVISPNTDIKFSIEGMPIIPCCGKSNIPDGEIFTAPIRDSVNGIITYNTPSPYQGNVYNNVSLTFENGKIIKATCDGDNEELNKIFNLDEGARYIGEFSLGLNPKIKNPVGDILYDEKIIGSIHFTPGQAYEDANNNNKSKIHWDLVLIQRKEFGGGEIYFDHKLIRKDGLFVVPELIHLNYDLK